MRDNKGKNGNYKRTERKDTGHRGEPVKFSGGRPVYKGDLYYGDNKRTSSGNSKYGGRSKYEKPGNRYEKPDERYEKSGNKYEKQGGRYEKSGDRYEKPYSKPANKGSRDDYDGRNRKPGYNDSAFGKRGDSERPPKKTSYKKPYTEPVETAVLEDELPYIIMGRNPVREAIKSGRSIDRILVVGERDGSLREIIDMARDKNILVQEVERTKLNEICLPFGHGGKSGNHQGIVARVPGVEYVDVDDILEIARERNEHPFIILLDGITDPYNMGSIIRSAQCAGAHGIVFPKRRSTSVTSAVVKVSSGAVEHIAVARVANIANTIEKLKAQNIWVAGADVKGRSMYDANLKGGLALVIGSEGDGLSRIVRENCDFLVSIPMRGEISSLNASVAGAILMFEKKRQDLSAE